MNPKQIKGYPGCDMAYHLLSLLLINLLTLSWNSSIAQPMELATQAFQYGYYEQAIKQWQIALTHFPTTQQRLQAELGLVQAYRHLGAYDKAIKVLNQALPLAQSTDTIYYVLLLNEQSKLYFSRETTQPKEAISLVTTALQLARNTYHPWVLASVLNHWGNMLTVQGDYESALGGYREALNHLQVYQPARKASSSSVPFSLRFSPVATATLYGKILINQARTTFRVESENAFQSTDPQQAFQESMAALTAAWQATQQWEDVYGQVFGLLALSQLAQQIQVQLTKPITHLNQLTDQALKLALQLALQLTHPTAKAYVYGYLGKRYEQKHDSESALAFTRQALFFAQQTQTKSLIYYWQWQLGRLLKAQGDRTGAIKAYQQAVTYLTPVRSSIASRGYVDLEEGFRERVAPVYFELADLLLQESQTTHSSSQRQQLLQQAKSTLELFKQAELQDYFQWDCTNPQPNCTGAEQLLDSHTAILYLIPLPDRLELLLNLPSKLLQVTVSVNESVLRDQIAAFLSPLRQHPNLEERARNRDSTETTTAICKPSTRGSIAHQFTDSAQTFLKPAQILYRWLIEPLSHYLANIDTLVIVPEGILYTIPFAALHDGQQFLIQKYALASIPSLCLSPSQFHHPFSQRILLGGLSQSVQGFSALPCAEYELTTVQTLVKTTPQPLLNERFTFPTLQRALNQTSYSTVHIASHGQFSANLDNTFILTYDDKLTMDKLERLMNLTTVQGKPVELLTLSACETAVGNERAALGLAGVALKAGVKSAVASLWQVDDEATPAVIIEFYSQLQNLNLSKAKALQQAQIRMLTAKNYVRYQHPYYWSAFLLIGHWL